MKWWIVSGAALTAIAASAVALAVALSPFDSSDPGAPSRSVTEADEPPPGSKPVTSIDDIDPDECDAVHNIAACDEQAVALARRDMAERLNTNVEFINVVSSEFTEWPDACLGIPKPDTACAQVITPGFKVILSSGLLEYEYHTDMGTRVELLEGQAE